MRGFTLIEVILVVAIISIISSLSAAFYARFITQNAVSNTQDQIVQSLRKAQTYAMMSRKSNTSGWGVNWDSGAHVLTLYQGPNFAGRALALDERFTINSNITITFSPASPTDVNFLHETGLPQNTPPTITISGQNNTKTVTVNTQGVVSR